MKTYEVVKEVYNPCAPDAKEFLELELEDPIAYVTDLYKNDKSAEISSSEKDGTLIVGVVCEAAQRHRYTFSEV